jgi:hypothetical protein
MPSPYCKFNVLDLYRTDLPRHFDPDNPPNRYSGEWNVYVDEWGGEEDFEIPHADMDAMIHAYAVDPAFMRIAAAKVIEAREAKEEIKRVKRAALKEQVAKVLTKITEVADD